MYVYVPFGLNIVYVFVSIKLISLHIVTKSYFSFVDMYYTCRMDLRYIFLGLHYLYCCIMMFSAFPTDGYIMFSLC